MRNYVLTPRECRILDAMVPVVLPEPPEDGGRFNRRLHYHIDRFLLSMPGFFRLLFHLGALAFDFSPLLFLARLRPFHRTDLQFRRYWINRTFVFYWSPIYRWFHVVRGLILLVYYSRGEQHLRMRYTPAAWIKSRVMNRRRKLHLIEEAHHGDQLKDFRFPSS